MSSTQVDRLKDLGVVETEKVLNGLVRACRSFIPFSLQPEHLSSYDTNRVAVTIGLMTEQSCGLI